MGDVTTQRLSNEAFDEGERGVGDVLPAVIDDQGVAAALDVFDLGLFDWIL